MTIYSRSVRMDWLFTYEVSAWVDYLLTKCLHGLTIYSRSVCMGWLFTQEVFTWVDCLLIECLHGLTVTQEVSACVDCLPTKRLHGLTCLLAKSLHRESVYSKNFCMGWLFTQKSLHGWLIRPTHKVSACVNGLPTKCLHVMTA